MMINVIKLEDSVIIEMLREYEEICLFIKG